MNGRDKRNWEERRRDHIPAGARKVAHKHSDAVAYIYEAERRGKPVPLAVAFSGKRGKPDWHFRFSSPDRRRERVEEHFAARATHMERKREQTGKARALAVGDVLKASWGYDQTNVDYYQVTALVGATMVEIRQIACEAEETAWAQGKSVPVPGKYVGEAMRRKVCSYDGASVRIASYAYAYKMEPKAMVGGKPVYSASHWTAYA